MKIIKNINKIINIVNKNIIILKFIIIWISPKIAQYIKNPKRKKAIQICDLSLAKNIITAFIILPSPFRFLF